MYIFNINNGIIYWMYKNDLYLLVQVVLMTKEVQKKVMVMVMAMKMMITQSFGPQPPAEVSTHLTF